VAEARSYEQHDYVLGHTDDELDRLIGQSQFFGELDALVGRL
jgi:hypothetical protein